MGRYLICCLKFFVLILVLPAFFVPVCAQTPERTGESVSKVPSKDRPVPVGTFKPGTREGELKDPQLAPPDNPDDDKKSKADVKDDSPEGIEHVGDGFWSKKWVLPRGAREFGYEGGYAHEIATWMSGPKYYPISGHRHSFGSLRWGLIYGSKRFVTFSWALEFIPVDFAIGNEVDNPRYTPGSTTESPTKRENTFGVGFNPASFRFVFLPKMRLRPQLGAGFGVMRHLKRVPTIDGTKGNARVDFQVGAQYMLSETKAINFGYKYYHLSNMYLAQRNPGYNVNMFFFGYSIFKKK